MKRHQPLSAEEIHALFTVDLERGVLIWKRHNSSHPRLTGTEAGYANKGKKSYWVVKVRGVQYKRAQIILAASTGAWPSDQVDHINGNSLDDRAANLRHATAQQNSWNHKGRSKSEPTPMGVRVMESGRFQARIRRDHSTRHLGVFDSAHEAEAAYRLARKELFGDFQ